MKRIHYNVICIGAGGTGGNFAKEFARYMAYLNLPNVSIDFSIVDGDLVEEKNRVRQPFSLEDVMQKKAVTLVDAIQDIYNIDNVYSYPDYIDEVDDLETIGGEHLKYSRSYLSVQGQDIIILIGAVDNHRARQVMNDFFYTQPNIVYIDSANEFSVGEICIGTRLFGKTIAPPRSHYYPDILKDKSPSALQISCGALNVSSPQHLATNLMAANLILAAVSNIISYGKVDNGIVYFDSLNYFSRFYPFEGKVPRKRLTRKGVKADEKVNA